MKKTIAALSFVGAVAYAAGNPDPVRFNYDQFRWMRPQFFDFAVNMNALDAGDVQAADITTPIIAAGVIDGGAAYFSGDEQVIGALYARNTVNSGSVACDGGTPAPTATVKSGANCVCNRTTGAICTVSSTTLTLHCVAGDTGGLAYVCL